MSQCDMTRDHFQQPDPSTQTTSLEDRFFTILKNHAKENDCPHSIKELFLEIKEME